MKNFIYLFLILFVSESSFAEQPSCVDEAVRASVLHNFETHGVNTNSCGIKALNIGEMAETYLACTSDETEPTEYVVVMNKSNCELSFIGAATQASTPSFESQEGLLDSISCEIDGYDEIFECE